MHSHNHGVASHTDLNSVMNFKDINNTANVLHVVDLSTLIPIIGYTHSHIISKDDGNNGAQGLLY